MELKKKEYQISAETIKKVLVALEKNWFLNGDRNNNKVIEADLTLQGEVESQNIRDVTEGKKNTYTNQLSEALDELIHANEDEIDDYTRINEICLKGKILLPDYKEKPI